MSALPPLVLALQPPAGGKGTLVAVRAMDGAVTAGLGAWPRPVPAGALLLHWPTRFAWTPPALAIQEKVIAREGACFPLGTVMQKLGLPAPRSLEHLAASLEIGLADFEDPVVFGRRALAALAERLEAPSPAPPREAVPTPAPSVAESIASLPHRPGVYTFLAADREVLYVGKARSLRQRVARHFGASAAEPEKSRILARRAVDLTWVEVGSDLEALLREQRRLREGLPALNRQERVHARRRGAWRRACALLVLSSAEPRCVEVCLVAGDGRFHWERAPRAPRVPAGLWERVGRFLDGESGWAPGEPERELSKAESAALAEIALSWLARHGDQVARIDLATESRGRPLQRRLRLLLSVDPAGGRIETR